MGQITEIHDVFGCSHHVSLSGVEFIMFKHSQDILLRRLLLRDMFSFWGNVLQ